MSDLPENILPDSIEQLLEMRRAERDKDNIKKMDDFLKSFREMKSKNQSLKRKNVIEKIFKEE